MKSRRISLLAALSVAVSLPAAALAQKSVRAGIEAWQRADFASAISIWRPLAEKGDADAASTWARPIASAAGYRPISRWPRPGSKRRPDPDISTLRRRSGFCCSTAAIARRRFAG
jgi:hypothetical protein